MELTKQSLEKMREAYAKADVQHVAEVAVKNNGINKSAEREVITVNDNQFVFSIDVDSEAVANQRQSGRCWMYSTLNFLRWHIEKNLDLPKGSFQLSQTYPFFFDKLEKSNFFFEQIIKYAGEDLDDRRITMLLSSPQQDGGDFDPMVALIEKYGLVPFVAMPDTAPSKNTADYNYVLNQLLRKDAWTLRSMVRERASQEALDHKREEMLGEIYRMTAVSFGQPPEKFDFEYRDSKNVYHVDRDLTPLAFYKKYVTVDLNDYIGVTNIPTDATPFNRMLTIDMTGEVIGAKRSLHYLNVDIEALKALAVAQLKDGIPVWFGCDVTQDADFNLGILSKKLYDWEAMFGIDLTMPKEMSYLLHQSAPTHAMMIAGVDLGADGKPIRWKIENSWGTENGGKPTGHDGYFIMDDPWFDDYVFEIAVDKKYLTDDQKKVLGTEPVVMPYWSSFNPVP